MYKKIIIACVVVLSFCFSAAEAAVEKISAEKYTAFIADGVSLVGFYADWCIYCHRIEPIVEAISDEFEAKISVGAVDIDEAKDICSEGKIYWLPTLVLFRDGGEIARRVGYGSVDEIREFILSSLQ